MIIDWGLNVDLLFSVCGPAQAGLVDHWAGLSAGYGVATEPGGKVGTDGGCLAARPGGYLCRAARGVDYGRHG